MRKPGISTLLIEADPEFRKVAEQFGRSIGWGNGYIIVPKGHPWFGKRMDWLAARIPAPGGITYAGPPKNLRLAPANLADADFKLKLEGWAIGFDTQHAFDTLELWPASRVQAEADKLKQFALTKYFEHLSKRQGTWLLYLNFLVLQFFFVRLARVYNSTTGIYQGYSFLKVLPFTGWFSRFLYWGDQRHLNKFTT